MIKIENVEVMGWEAAIRGMRNPMNSWEKSDSIFSLCADGCMAPIDCSKCHNGTYIGPNDYDLMKRLRNAGTDHRKFMRMITVYVDITAPLYWWKEFKTYRAGRRFADDEPGIIDDGYLEYDIEINSCSTMHKIHDKEFTLDDFSHEKLINIWDFEPEIRDIAPIIEANLNADVPCNYVYGPDNILNLTINMLNKLRELYIQTKDKSYWYTMIQLLPSSYNQKRTVMLNYEVLANMYKARRDHKLDEWVEFCTWITTLPYPDLITGEFEGDKKQC